MNQEQSSLTRLNFDILRDANSKRGVEWVGTDVSDEVDALFRAVELGGEAGEALNAVKKLYRWCHDQKGGVELQESRQAIADELADVIICADRLAENFGINLAEAIIKKFNETSDKHGFETKL